MSRSPRPGHAQGRLIAALVGFVLLQALAAVFFVGDALTDLWLGPTSPHSLFEGLVALALLAGSLAGMIALRSVMARHEAQARAIEIAAGNLAAVIEAQFDRWGLTPAERDVAMLAIKGVEPAEIASLRGSAPGTVRAQLTHVYAKAGVSGRSQLLAGFVEDLLDRA